MRLKSNRFMNSSVGYDIFKRLFSLEYLDLSDNSIAILSSACFDDLSNLKSLNLNNNKLVKISWNFFSSLEQLEFLSIRNNSIGSISTSAEATVGRNLTSIREIDMSFNFITEIEEFTFYAHYKLVKLNLKGNLIQKIQVNSFDNLKNLTDLNLDRQINGNLRQKNFYRSNSCASLKSL